MSIQDTRIDTDYDSYVKRIEKLESPFGTGWFEIYEKSRDIFDDVCFKQNLITDTNNEQLCTRIEIVGLFKYYFCNEKKPAINMWLDLVSTNKTYDGIHRVMYLLAEHYNAKKKCDKAVQYYLLAVEAGSSPAMNKLGLYYKHIETDYEKAVQYYELAIDAGNSNAMCNLAYYYEDVENDYMKAVKYYLMAIDAGNRNAMYNLAYYYEDIEKDYEKAVQYYELAIDAGDIKAMNILACHYERIVKDYVKAIQYYKLAIEAGNCDAIYNLGMYYMDIANDYEKAEEYFMKGLGTADGDCAEKLMEVFDINNKLNYESVFPIVQIIVSNKNLHKEYETVRNILSNPFLEWVILNELKHVLGKKFLSILKTLEQNIHVIRYKHKLSRATRYGIMDTCPICLEGPVLNIDIGCSHGVCPKCYMPGIKCFYRCKGQYIS